MNSNALAAMAQLLNENGLNYSVFLQTYRVPIGGVASPQQIVQAALGNSAVIGGVQKITTHELLSEVQASLAYEGSSGTGPGQGVIQSEQFKELLSTLLADAEAASSAAVKVEQFWLKEGHPAYPVFWDFAFLLTGKKETMVFIGSSSD